MVCTSLYKYTPQHRISEGSKREENVEVLVRARWSSSRNFIDALLIPRAAGQKAVAYVGKPWSLFHFFCCWCGLEVPCRKPSRLSKAFTSTAARNQKRGASWNVTKFGGVSRRYLRTYVPEELCKLQWMCLIISQATCMQENIYYSVSAMSFPLRCCTESTEMNQNLDRIRTGLRIFPQLRTICKGVTYSSVFEQWVRGPHK